MEEGAKKIMRYMEILVVAINFSILVRTLFFNRQLNRLNVILLGVAGLVTGMQILLEGYRWQMIPAYLILLLPIMHIFLFSHRAPATSWINRILKGGFIILCLAVTIDLPILIPVFSFSEPTGSYKVGTTSLHLIDDKRMEEYAKDSNDKRELMVQIWYPAKTGSGKANAPYLPHPKELAAGLAMSRSLPKFTLGHLDQVKTNSFQDAQLSKKQSSWPLLLFSHGMDLYRNQNTFQLEELVSHGYIVVAIGHTYDTAATVFPDGHIALNRPKSDEGLPTWDKHMSLWTDDVKFILDKIEQLNNKDNGFFHNSIDMNRIGMLGHSFGGAATMQMLMQDDRVKAGINMDGGLYGAIATQGVGKPFLMMETQDMEEYMAKAKEANKEDLGLSLFKELDRRKKLALTGGGYSLSIPNTNHTSYTDLSLFSPLLKSKGEDSTYVHRTINDVSLEFFNKYVKGDASALMDKIATRYSEIQLTKSK